MVPKENTLYINSLQAYLAARLSKKPAIFQRMDELLTTCRNICTHYHCAPKPYPPAFHFNPPAKPAGFPLQSGVDGYAQDYYEPFNTLPPWHAFPPPSCSTQLTSNIPAPEARTQPTPLFGAWWQNNTNPEGMTLL